LREYPTSSSAAYLATLFPILSPSSSQKVADAPPANAIVFVATLDRRRL
jgi:hypothetical protein